jgi:predicted DNA-binding protein
VKRGQQLKREPKAGTGLRVPDSMMRRLEAVSRRSYRSKSSVILECVNAHLGELEARYPQTETRKGKGKQLPFNRPLTLPEKQCRLTHSVPKPIILKSVAGVVAQLVEHHNGIAPTGPNGSINPDTGHDAANLTQRDPMSPLSASLDFSGLDSAGLPESNRRNGSPIGCSL